MHGVATATACALFGLPCVVYMGEEDTIRQAPNVARMQLLGAEVVTVTSGSRTLKDAINEALRDWAASVRRHALRHRLGRGTPSVPGDRPRSPARDRRRGQGAAPRARGPRPGRGGRLRRRREQRDRHLRGVRRPNRASGSSAWRPAAAATGSASTAGRSRSASRACCTARYSYLLQDEQGQVVPTHSISAGLDYPGVGPEHAFLKDSGPRDVRLGHRRGGARGVRARSRRSRGSCRRSSRPTRSAGCLRRPLAEGSLVLVNLSGRGDKDLETVRAALGSGPGAPRG